MFFRVLRYPLCGVLVLVLVVTTTLWTRCWSHAGVERIMLCAWCPSHRAGERGLLEVTEPDFSSCLAHSKSLSIPSGVSSHADCTSLALPSASACALAASMHDSCSAPSSAAVPLCMHVDGTLALY